MRVEIQDANGTPIDGFALIDADEIYGDHIERAVTWKGQADVGALASRPVRLRFVLQDGDLFAFRFRPEMKMYGNGAIEVRRVAGRKCRSCRGLSLHRSGFEGMVHGDNL